ncbi:aconitase X [Sphingomonas colocasiae]|uniref:Aconitase X catalytic domain-containing protein n=1 Tax=Sphingomonas colocasiae TaxID=1848973 RepID=A0ABS7PL11_9SPHN|nr:aconitase X catalytic domain-containing protein [Sphingomonas colocasiae]MBY8821981.1 aconitase X catalytic domain-containing protein [Sphingomonas colocasiae]
MELEPIDRALLDGDHGAAAARAMAMLVRYGEAGGAPRFVSIESAHIDGCLYHGPSSIDFARRFADLGGRVRVPTTLNVAAVDVVHPGWHCGPPELIDAQRELTDLHERLGCVATLTCAPYQRMVRPRPGEHVAWAESNAIVFVNSVLGARTDRYGDFTDLCAALTGRVPLAGLHRDENRRPRCMVAVPGLEAAGLPRDLYFAAVGYVIGQRAPGQVPLVRGVPVDATEDELKALGAAGASSGSLALFHAEGVTPEAQWAAEQAARAPLAEIAIQAADLHDAVSRLCPVVEGEAVAAVCLGTPHYSLDEFRILNAVLDGRGPAEGVALYVSTSREIAAAVEHDPAFAPLRRFDARIVVDTCTYLAPVVRNTQGAILTTSAKYAHYGPGNLQRRVGLMTLERCIRSAALGRVAPPC